MRYDKNIQPGRLRSVALAVCALSGLALALSGTFSLRAGSHFSEGAPESPNVAKVGDKSISWRRYREVVSDIETDKREPLTDEDRQFALQRLIDEELLIARALELNLDESVPAVRKSLSSAVLAHVSASASTKVPTEEELVALYEAEQAFFAQPARFGVRWYRLRGLDGGNRSGALASLKALQAERLSGSLSSGSGFEEVAQMPRSLMPVSTLSNYLGGTLATSLEQLTAGDYSSPLFLDGVWHVVYVDAYVPATIADFESLRQVVEAELVRRTVNAELQSYLRWLAGRAHITIDPAFE